MPGRRQSVPIPHDLLKQVKSLRVMRNSKLQKMLQAHHASYNTSAALQSSPLSLFHCPPSRGPHFCARALRPSSPKLLWSRQTRVMVLLTRRASARACRVGTTHMAKWTADPLAFHCSCAAMHCQLAVPHVWHKHAQGTCQDWHSCPVMSDPHVTIQPTHY